MPTYPDPNYEPFRRNQKRLQREILKHLQDSGPLAYDALYVRFSSHGSAEIKSAIAELQMDAFFSVDEQKMVTITESGVTRLNDAEYWS